MNDNDKNNAGFEFTALMLSLLPPFIFICLVVVMVIVTGGSVSISFVLLCVSLITVCITIALMGLDVNRKIRRVELLESWADFHVIGIYYREIAKKKKFPALFIVFFINSAALSLACIYDFILRGFDKFGYIFLLLVGLLILLAFILRYLSKYVIDNSNGQ